MRLESAGSPAPPHQLFISVSCSTLNGVAVNSCFSSETEGLKISKPKELSPSILAGLHEISRCVSGRNYQRALELHTQVVSSSNFSEISAFMPVLKVLMTIGNKLGV